MLTVEDVIAFAEKDASRRKSPIGVYWFECREDRQSISDSLAKGSNKICVIPLLPRGGFDNANALPSDFIELVEENRAFVEPLALAAQDQLRAVCFVLVTRTRLRDPLIGSPVKIPTWFPLSGGLVISIDIVDVATSATSTLKSESEAIGRMQMLLYETQGLMLQRLTRVREQNQNATHKLFGEILAPGQKVTDFLVEAEKRHALSTAQGFRAVASPKSSELLGRIVATIGERTPAQLPAFGQALFRALDIDSADANAVKEPLFAIALRSTIKEFEVNRATRGMRNVALTLYLSSQLVTAEAHAGEYGEFEVTSMRSMFSECESMLVSFKALM